MDENQISDWVREQFQRANQHLATNGLMFKSVAAEESRYLAPYMAVWKTTTQDDKQYWVISGDLPVDYISEECAPNAREALRYFCYQWQAKAENLSREAGEDKTQKDYAELLQTKADMIYDLSMEESIWQSV